MNTSLIRQAAAQAKTCWLEQALTNLLPQVWSLTTESPEWQATASNWANQIDLLFEEKKLTTPEQQKNRRTDVANALRVFTPNHPVIPFILLPSDVYTQLNNEQANRLNTRANNLFSIQQANELVEKAIALLGSEKPNEVAAGLAVLVGRRISEILISKFKSKTAYSLLFCTAVKRRDEIEIEFEIPTLAPAHRVLEAITHLQEVWNIRDLRALNLPESHLKRRINARYSGVPHACRQHFADLVPGRKAETDDGKRLYTHLFRAVYAEIATYYYKPDWVPDHRFKAEIQGHFKLTTNGQKIPNYSARQNYDDYLIRDRVAGESGVKLGLPGVEVLEVFQPEKATNQNDHGAAVSSKSLKLETVNALIYRAGDRLLFAQGWAEAVTGLILLTGRTIQSLMGQRLEEKSGFSILVDGLEVPTLMGARQVVTAWQRWQKLEPLPEEEMGTAIRKVCERTFDDLVLLQSVSDLRALYSAIAIYWFCPLEVEKGTFLGAIQASGTAGFMADRDGRGLKLGQHNVQVLEVLRRRKAAAAEEGATMMDEPITAAEGANALSSTEMSSRLEAKPKVRHRRKMLSVDPDLLKTVAASFNIQVRGRGGAGGLSYEAALGQILEQLAQGQSYAVTRTTSQFLPDDGAIAAIRDQARTLAWLTERMEALEQLVETLKLERDEAIAQVRQVQVSAQGEALRLENQRLKQECDEARRKLQAFRQLLLGTESLTDAFQDEKEQELEQGQEQELEQRELEQEQAVDDRMMRPVESAIAPALTRSSVDVSDSPKSPKKRIPEKEALHHIRRAVQALISLNSQEGRAFNDKWYISFPVVQTLLRTHGLSANQKHVAAVFDELKTELEKHHEQHEIGSRHNRRHPNLEKIAEIIELNELMG
ncbi:MAG TPA: protelomerase family protein [Allocoleopsis sp.]